jgi:hypothetical protein
MRFLLVVSLVISSLVVFLFIKDISYTITLTRKELSEVKLILRLIEEDIKANRNFSSYEIEVIENKVDSINKRKEDLTIINRRLNILEQALIGNGIKTSILYKKGKSR